MSLQIIPKERQAKGAFNGGEIVENKPIGFPREGGVVRPYSNLFYWAYAEAKTDSTIGLHPHQGFEIMSFVLKGQIRHYDTKLKEWRPLSQGDAQIIRAGNGISHAEFMAEGSAMFQIWLDPDLSKTMQQPASYDDYKMDELPLSQNNGTALRTYIGPGSPFRLDTSGVEIKRMDADGEFDFSENMPAGNICSAYVIRGGFSINGEPVKTDDFVLVKDTDKWTATGKEGGSLFYISSPSELGYATYAEIMAGR